MLGKTHMAVGVAASLIVLQPDSLEELVLGTGVSLIGSVISDIDAGTSESHKEANKVTALAFLVTIAIIAAEKIWNIGIFERIMKDSSMTRIISSVCVFLGVCAFGKNQPHRSFMHSLLALIILTGCVGVFFPSMMMFFGIAFSTHILLDLLNKKGEQLLYPLRKGFALDICASNGIINKTFLLAGTATAAYELIKLLLLILE